LACPPPVTHDRGCRGLHAADALFIGLGCVGGLALPRVWIHAGTASGGLILAGGVLSIAGAFLPSSLARPVPVGLWLSRGLSCLRLRRRRRRLPLWPHPLLGAAATTVDAVSISGRAQSVGSGEDHADDRRQGRRSVRPGDQPAPLPGDHPD